MADLSTLHDRLDALRALRAEGTSRVRFSDGREVAYRTDSEIAAAIADIERQIHDAARAAPKTVYLTTTKGL
jgi:hypothetical protein